MKKSVLFGTMVTAAAVAQPWTPLFNGKNLDGWRRCNGEARYTVENGEIVGRTVDGSPNSFLCTDREFGDFVFEAEVKVDPRLNSGFQIRSHRYAQATEVRTYNRGWRTRTHEAGRVHGYQVEIASEASNASGGIYDEGRRGWLDNVHCGAFKDNQWNAYRIEARGVSVKTWVNGVACADMVDPVDLSGFIALQVHAYKGPHPAEVRWRNLRIQDLGRSSWKPVDVARWKLDGGGRVERVDGAWRLTQVAAEKPKRGLLLSDREYADFTMRLKYKITRGNSGVFYRVGDVNQRGDLGYEIEVDPTRDLGGFQEPGKRGWILHGKPEDFTANYRPNDWNEMTIHAQGGRHVIHVNGLKTAEFKNDPGRTAGRIALQLNGREDLEVFYKDIEMLEAAK